MCNSDIRNVEEIPPPYRNIFNEYPCFNAVQSRVLDDILYTDDSVVVSAPTGAGKTVIFELAIVRLLTGLNNGDISQCKIIYICPIKSLCQERLIDWHKKFSTFGINCISVTGDSENVNFHHLVNHNLIISTPEKWDSLTRKWRDNEKLIKVVKLFMIDEVHLLNEESRGSTLEVIVSRMKTVENSVSSCVNESGNHSQKIRFIALSATVPNVEDIAEWIGKPPNIKFFRFSEEMRPVKLKKIVLGYNRNPKTSPFKFDISLNYKLQSLMIQYSEGKPTLIFCSTRKSVEMTANHIVQSLKIHLNEEQKNKLMEVANLITDVKAKATIRHGVGYHHAGLIHETRHIIENLFRQGDLPVLVTSSTLAMGVNLPAHLVIVKSTKCYDNCGFRDYTETAIHQMIGRAGRPQFDTSATALILTTNDDKHKFEQMVGCGQPIESNLHRHLTEHLNAEVVLRTITDLDVAMQWLASTFLYVRARKNPHHYGLNVGLSKDQIDKKLLDMCLIDLNKLVSGGMLTMDQNIVITPTMTGQIMAKYYIAYETMKLFTQISGTEILIQILALISKCHEFAEMRLRVNDKKTLNLFNKNTKRATIRFPLNGKIKTWDMKVNCIIQAVLGNLDILDHSLLSESFTIMRNGARIAKCLTEYLGTRRVNCYTALLSTIILCKCFHAKLWENSPYLSKQLSGIGSVTSNQLVNAGKTTFQKILESNPRDIELIIKRKAPMGNLLIEEVQHIPRYEMVLEKVQQKQLKLTINLVNSADLKEKSTVNVTSVMTLLVGNNLNEILLYEKYQHSYMMENNMIIKLININTEDLEEVNAHLISENWVGFDCNSTITFEHSDKTNKSETVNNGENSEKKAPTYIQMFLDMYMKTKKKGTETVPKKQKVKKDDPSEVNNEITKPPKKLVQQKIQVDEIKSGQETNKIKLQERQTSAEKIEISAKNNDVITESKSNRKNKPVNSENRNQDVVDEIVCLADVDQYENDVMDEFSDSSNTSLFSDKLSTTMFNNHVNKIYEAVMDDVQTKHMSDGYEKENSLVIVESEENENQQIMQSNIEQNTGNASVSGVIDFEDKILKDPSLYYLSEKYGYNTKRPRKKKICKRKLGRVNSLPKEEAEKIQKLEEFKFPNKKKFCHQPNLENVPDSTEDDKYYAITDILEPSKKQIANSEHNKSAMLLADIGDSSKNDRSKENAQKNITWRSPLVFSPTVKFSPKISFQNQSIEVENDTQNETINETFETTSSKSAANLTINIQRTPGKSKSNTRFINKKRGTKFPLCDRDYLSNSQQEAKDDVNDICSSSFLDMLGIDKSNQNTLTQRSKKFDASPTINYYSHLLSEPIQVQKQKPHPTNNTEKSNYKGNKENIQNYSSDLQSEENGQVQGIMYPHPIRETLEDRSQDPIYFNEPCQNFILSQNGPLTYNRRGNYSQNNQFLEPRLMQNYIETKPSTYMYENLEMPGNRQCVDYPYNMQNVHNKQCGFIPPNVMMRHSDTHNAFLNETFVSNNYPDQGSNFCTQRCCFPHTNYGKTYPNDEICSRPILGDYNYQSQPEPKPIHMHRSRLPANSIDDDFQHTLSSQYSENNLRNVNNPYHHNQMFSERENYENLRISRSQCNFPSSSRSGIECNITPDFTETNDQSNLSQMRYSQDLHTKVNRENVADQTLLHRKSFEERPNEEKSSKNVNQTVCQSTSASEHDQELLQNLKHPQNPQGFLHGGNTCQNSSQNFSQEGNNLDCMYPQDRSYQNNLTTLDNIQYRGATSQANIPNRSLVYKPTSSEVMHMLNKSFEAAGYNQENNNLPQTQEHRDHIYSRQQDMNNSFAVYPQGWNYRGQNYNYSHNFEQQNFNVANRNFVPPIAGRHPQQHFPANNRDLQVPASHNKQYMMNKFLSSMNQQQ